MIETVAIIVQTSFNIEVFCREPVAEEVGEITGLRNGTAKIVILVGGGNVARFVDVLRYVAVAVDRWEIELSVTRDGQEPANAARALEGVGNIESPVILYLGRVGRTAVDCRNGLVNQVPVVVYERAVLDGVPLVRLDWRRRWRSRSDGQPLNLLRYPAVAVPCPALNAEVPHVESVVLRAVDRRVQRLFHVVGTIVDSYCFLILLSPSLF